MSDADLKDIKINTMKYNNWNTKNRNSGNPANPQIRKIMIQTKSAEILNSILELI